MKPIHEQLWIADKSRIYTIHDENGNRTFVIDCGKEELARDIVDRHNPPLFKVGERVRPLNPSYMTHLTGVIVSIRSMEGIYPYYEIELDIPYIGENGLHRQNPLKQIGRTQRELTNSPLVDEKIHDDDNPAL